MSNLVLIFWREEGVDQEYTIFRFNISDMKINQGRRNPCVSKPLLHIKDVLSVFQKVSSRTVSQGVYGDGMIEAGLSQGVLEYGTYIPRCDALRCDSPSMCLEDEVVTGVPLPECPQYDEHLRGDGYIPVLVPLTLAYEEHPPVEADILPSEPAHFTDPECTVVGKRQQSLVVQPAAMDKPGHTALGEYSGKFLRLAHFWKHQSSGLFKSHDLVVVLQSEHRVFEEGDAVPFQVQQRGEISFDVILCEIVRQLLEIQRCLRNLELVVIDTVLGILGQTQLFMEKRNAVFKIRHNRACLVYECLRHGNSGEGEL